MEDKQPHIAILPTPGMGHLIPLAELAKRLVHNFNCTVTFIVPTDGSPIKQQRAVLEALPPSISSDYLPPVSFDDIPQDTKIETLISLTIVRSLPSLRDSLKKLAESKRLVALVADLFGTDGFQAASEVGILKYIFYPANATCLSLFLYLPTLDQEVTCEYKDLPEPVKIPGSTPIHGRELLDPVQDRKNDAYKWVLYHAKRYRLADGIMVNSFVDLEPGPFRALQEKEPGKPSVYPVGPLVNMERKVDSTSGGGSDCCLKWLDNQPGGSVLFVSFGSGGTLSSDQIRELALGLEISEQRFLWVVRRPNDEVANATYFKLHGNDEAFEFLPQGFLERTKGRGLVVPSWAPQAQVLGHGSTGGFLTHCGWNSTLESVVNGVPMIVWPLYAEQRMNAFALTEDIKVALRPRVSEKSGLVERGEIATVVKGLMEGKQGKSLRNRMKDLKEAAAAAMAPGEASTKALAEVVYNWRTKMQSH